jgi:hypothetical protein
VLDADVLGVGGDDCEIEERLDVLEEEVDVFDGGVFDIEDLLPMLGAGVTSGGELTNCGRLGVPADDDRGSEERLSTGTDNEGSEERLGPKFGNEGRLAAASGLSTEEEAGGKTLSEK